MIPWIHSAPLSNINLDCSNISCLKHIVLLSSMFPLLWRCSLIRFTMPQQAGHREYFLAQGKHEILVASLSSHEASNLLQQHTLPMFPDSALIFAEPKTRDLSLSAIVAFYKCNRVNSILADKSSCQTEEQSGPPLYNPQFRPPSF